MMVGTAIGAAIRDSAIVEIHFSAFSIIALTNSEQRGRSIAHDHPARSRLLPSAHERQRPSPASAWKEFTRTTLSVGLTPAKWKMRIRFDRSVAIATRLYC